MTDTVIAYDIETDRANVAALAAEAQALWPSLWSVNELVDGGVRFGFRGDQRDIPAEADVRALVEAHDPDALTREQEVAAKAAQAQAEADALLSDPLVQTLMGKDEASGLVVFMALPEEERWAAVYRVVRALGLNAAPLAVAEARAEAEKGG